jgi:hypothetical protein
LLATASVASVANGFFLKLDWFLRIVALPLCRAACGTSPEKH